MRAHTPPPPKKNFLLLAVTLGINPPSVCADYGTAFGEVVRILAHTLNSLHSDTSDTRSAILPAAKEQVTVILKHC